MADAGTRGSLSFSRGLVLTGGASSRMGTDKAFVEIDGQPMVVRVRTALLDGGATRVDAIGGDAQRLREVGLTSWADRWPGEGPMAGIVSVAQGLRGHPDDVIVFASCDLPALRGDGVAALVRDLRADTSVDIAVPVVEGIWQSHLLAFRRHGLGRLAAEFDKGKRSLWRTLSALDGVLESSSIEPSQLVDLDSPEDVADYAQRSRHGGPRPPA